MQFIYYFHFFYRYANRKPAYYLNRAFKLSCSQLGGRFSSNEYVQTVTVTHPQITADIPRNPEENDQDNEIDDTSSQRRREDDNDNFSGGNPASNAFAPETAGGSEGGSPRGSSSGHRTGVVSGGVDHPAVPAHARANPQHVEMKSPRTGDVLFSSNAMETAAANTAGKIYHFSRL